jgi:hypothetical protein|tara:strand:- start:8468 stop:9571 length:1104 start_codon:yes stop_codon:yes gene_type:complete
MDSKNKKKIKFGNRRISLLPVAVLLVITLAYAATNYGVITSTDSSIDEWGTCRKVINNLEKNLFIPTRTQAEWQSFFDNPPLGILLENCVASGPTGLSASAGNSQISLSWSAPSSDGGAAITNYKIYRGTSSGSEALLTTIGNLLSYSDPGLANGQSYYYQVSAVNSGGESDLSNEASATPCNPGTIVSYGTWSSCSVSCGGGTQTRTNVNQCGQNVQETQNCNTQACCDPSCPAASSYSCGVAFYSECGTYCGTGTSGCSVYKEATVNCGTGSKTANQLCQELGYSSASDSKGYWHKQCAQPLVLSCTNLECSIHSTCDCAGCNNFWSTWDGVTQTGGGGTNYDATDPGYNCQSYNPGWYIRLLCN